jgi:hypothetical protein
LRKWGRGKKAAFEGGFFDLGKLVLSLAVRGKSSIDLAFWGEKR